MAKKSVETIAVVSAAGLEMGPGTYLVIDDEWMRPIEIIQHSRIAVDENGIKHIIPALIRVERESGSK